MAKKKASKKTARNIDFSDFAVAVIDVLNQRSKLAKIRVPETEEEEKEIIPLLQETFGVISNFRKVFDGFFESYQKSQKKRYKGLSKDRQHLVKRIRKVVVKKQQFSDTIVLYTSLADRQDRFPISSIEVIIYALGIAFLHSLAVGHVFRGGLDIGFGSDNCFQTEELYGPALYRAYRLESEIAKYPRIVVGNEFIGYILTICKIAGNSTESRYQRETALTCKGMICNDHDGIGIIDFAGKAFRELFAAEERMQIKGQIEKALDFTRSELNRFIKNGDMKLVGRYKMLLYYLENRYDKYWAF